MLGRETAHVWFLSLGSTFLLSKHIMRTPFISWALCGSTPNCWINRVEVKQKKSTSTHRGIITRNVFKPKTLLTRKKLYREKFKLFSVFPSEIFSYRVDVSIVQKKLFKQKIKVWIHSKRRHKRGPEGFKAPNVDQRKRTPSRGSHDHWGVLAQETRQHQGPPHCHLSAPSQKGLKINVKVSPLLPENEDLPTMGIFWPMLAAWGHLNKQDHTCPSSQSTSEKIQNT